jgi:serine/threonine-protein kinase
MDLRAGQQVDHYTLIEPLGEGGQGSVWKVLDPREGGVVRALKLVSLAETGPIGFDRARREARILATASHPALVTCHGLFEDPRAGLVGLVMDLVPGETLAEAAAAGRLDRGRALAALAQIAGALAHIHHAGLVHRDLKPENVLVTDGFREDPHRPGAVKLVDFGIAAPASNPTRLTATGTVIGTLPYLAPELVDPASWGKAEGPARDVFAFGVMAYVLLFGRHPTGLGPGASMIDYARAYKAAQAGRIPWPPEGLDGKSGASVAACLTLRPADRPRDGGVILDLLHGRPASKRPSSSDWSGPTAPHREVTERSPTPPVEAPPVQATAPMHIPGMHRTVPAAPVAAAVTAATPGSTRGCWVGVVLAIGAIGGAILAGVAITASREQPATRIDAPPTPMSTPQFQPSPGPAPAAKNDFGACCRDDSCDRTLTKFTCPVCVGDPPALPRGFPWQMRIGGVTDHVSANRVCVRVEGSPEDELCVPYSSVPGRPGRAERRRVTTEDIEAGRVFFTLYAGAIPLAKGYGRRKVGKAHFLVTALCVGLLLRVEVPGQDDFFVSVYLDDR